MTSFHRITFNYFFVVFLFYSLGTNAQSFRNFPSLTGKKDIAVNCVLQSPSAELFIGTTSGLVIYDGENFKLFSKENGLDESGITALFLQRDNTLWIGHKSGKVTLYKNKKFFPFQFNEKLSEEPVSAFAESNGVWIASYGSGLSIFKNNKLIRLNSESGISDDFVYTLCVDSKGRVWAGTDAGITCIEMKNEKPSFAIMSMKEGLPDNIVRNLAYTPQDEIWVAMQDSGVCKYDVATSMFKRVAVASNWKYGTSSSLCLNNAGDLFIGSKQSGVIRYSKNKSGKESLTVFDIKNGLLNNDVGFVFVDREENLWVATAKGLSELSQGRVSSLNSKNGLLSDKVLTFYVDKKENYWISTDKGLVKYSTLQTGETIIKNYFLTDGRPEKQITCMYEDSQGFLWFGTYGNGLSRFNPTTEKEENISEKQGLANNNVSSISAGNNGDIWVSTLGGGISKIHFEGESRIIKSYSSADSLPGDYVYRVLSDSKNNLWVGVDGYGLIEYHDGLFVNVSEKNKLKGKTVFSIVEDRAGQIWFSASEEGIYRYNPSTKAYTNYSLLNNLRDNNPSALTSFENSLVAVHAKGVDVLDIYSGKITYFNVSENDLEPNLNGSFSDRLGNIWISTNSGLIKFRAGQIFSDTISPLVHLNSIIVQYQPFPIDSTTLFSYKQNNFVFNYSAVWFRSNEKIKFRYKLEGVDNDFFETENKSVSYSSLPSGSYTFSIAASNSEGVWSRPLLYSFSIASPIWQRWWFWLCFVLLVTGLIYFFIKYRLRALQKEKEILEKKVDGRTAEIKKQSKIIELKNLELERLSLVASETSNVIIIMDERGCLEWVNDSFERINCITLEELKKQKGETIFDISNNPEIKNIVADCIRKKHSVTYESRNIINNHVMWESSTLTPIYDAAGKLRKLIIIDTDVTERKKTEDVIRQKNKDITDSIEYAKKIQTSILPSTEQIKESLPNSFVLFLQKDIVSGDFYWFARKGDLAIIAAVDCTGHGVPGAFMSLIGYNLLNQIIVETEITEPGKILDELNRGVIKALYQNSANSTTKDGMDVGLCTINTKTKVVQYAGAMRPLYMFKGDEFVEIKGDKMSIGTQEGDREHEIKFSTQAIKAKKGDVFYISSDGYADQFGGESGKKMMTKNFKEILKKIKDKPFNEQQKQVLNYHKTWKGDFEQVDDILVIGFSL